MKYKILAAALTVFSVSSVQAATLNFETALFRGETTANTTYRTANLGPQPTPADRRTEIIGVERGLVSQMQDLSFVNGISAGRAVEGRLQNVSQGFFRDQEFAVAANLFASAECLSNPTQATCPPRIEMSNTFEFDFSVDEAAILNFSGFYERGDTRHIMDDQTVLSIFNVNRDREVFFAGTSNPTSANYIFDAGFGSFTGELLLDPDVDYRFRLAQRTSVTGGPVGVPITDTAQFLFGATLTDVPVPVDLAVTQARLDAAVAAVPLPATGWLLVAGLAGLGATRSKKRTSRL